MNKQLKNTVKALSKLMTYDKKHTAPFGTFDTSLIQHATTVHDERTQLSQMKKAASFHKINTMAESFPSTTTRFSLIQALEKNGKTQQVALFPSPNIVETRQENSGGSVTSKKLGAGYMEAVLEQGKPVHHVDVRAPEYLSNMPYFGSAPVTSPELVDKVTKQRKKHSENLL